MDKCFVIQPFDKGKFDQRYRDSYKLAIEKAGLKPYRIDSDLSVRIPIENIEKEIRSSVLCFADISIDNPNVWYELGYAYACGKDVVMVCSDERGGVFPFDIRHRQVIMYQTKSKGDFELLESLITEKIRAYLATSKTIKTLVDTPLIKQQGLLPHEIALLLLITGKQVTGNDYIHILFLSMDMNKAGYPDTTTIVAVRSLEKKEMVETKMKLDAQANEYLACRVTRTGENWIVANQNHLIFSKDNKGAK